MRIDLQFKSIYNSIQKYQETTSGNFHWDNIKGADITTASGKSVWDNYVSSKVCYHPIILLKVLKYLPMRSG
jgi:hypothetical protein